MYQIRLNKAKYKKTNTMGINFFTIVLLLFLVREAVNLKMEFSIDYDLNYGKIWMEICVNAHWPGPSPSLPRMPDDWYLFWWYLVGAGESRGDPSEANNSSGRQPELHSETHSKSHPDWEEEQTQSPHQKWQRNNSGPILQFVEFVEKIRLNN